MGFLPNVQNFINCIGNNDDFVCFDVQKKRKRMLLFLYTER